MRTIKDMPSDSQLKILEKHICDALAILDGSFSLSKYGCFGYLYSHSEFKAYYNELEWHEKYTVLETIFKFIKIKSVVENS